MENEIMNLSIEEVEQLEEQIKAAKSKLLEQHEREMMAEFGRGRQSIARSPPHTPGGTLLPISEFFALTPKGAEATIDLGLASAAKKRALPSPDGAESQPRRDQRVAVKSGAPPIAGLMGGGPPPPPPGPSSAGQSRTSAPSANPSEGVPSGVLPPVLSAVQDPSKNKEKAKVEAGRTGPMSWSTAEIYSASVKLCGGITRNIKSSSSKLNKAEIAEIACLTQEVTALFMALTLRLKDAEHRADKAESELAAALEKARAHEIMVPAQVPAQPQGPSVPSFASILRMSGQASRPIPQQPGMSVAIYPAENNENIKTAEETKAHLKASVNPRELGVQVSRLRKVGNGGVLLQTTSAESVERLKKALPSTLRVSEPKERVPLVAIINVEGDIGDNATFMETLIAQNFEETEREAISKGIEVAFKKWRRGGAATTVVLRCSSAVRERLINKERVYLGWERYLCRDYVDVVCCSRCQMYGHSVKVCKAAKEVCGKCGAEGHSKGDCTSSTTACATCKAFKKEGAGSHKTASTSCPARAYAIDRALSRVNYG
ncbi:hypothetical protein O0L34_g18647 [Tuta absoluta]|nr:hypothetical protein O0L34_g18647 [Tuta absoluta]